MKRETYKGRKLQTIKSTDYGYSRAKINGVDLGRHLGNEDAALAWMKGQIDFIDQEDINGDRWAAEWYAPGTFELCENNHPKTIGGECLHSYCAARRPAPVAVEPTEAIVPEINRAERRQHFADTHPRNAYPIALDAVTAFVREMPLGGDLRVPVVAGAPEVILTRDDLHSLAYSGHTTVEAVKRVRTAVDAHIRHGVREVYLMFPTLRMRPALYLCDVLALLTRWDDRQAEASDDEDQD